MHYMLQKHVWTLSALIESESVKESKKNFDDVRIKNIKKDFNELKDSFSKPKIKEIRRKK